MRKLNRALTMACCVSVGENTETHLHTHIEIQLKSMKIQNINFKTLGEIFHWATCRMRMGLYNPH